MKAPCVLVFAIQLLAGDPVEVLKDLRSGPVRYTSAIGHLDEKNLSKASLGLLAPKDIRIGSVSIYPSRSDMHRAQSQGGSDCNYEAWLHAVNLRGFMEKPPGCPPQAQAIKIGDAIVLRLGNANCATRLLLLQGNHNPTQVTLQGTIFNVVDLEIHYVGFQAKRPHLTFFMQTDGEVTIRRARELIQHFEQIANSVDMSVILRKDKWFIEECGFPISSSFTEPRADIPAKESFLSSKQVYCGFHRPWGVQCYE